MPDDGFYKSAAWLRARDAALRRDHWLCARCLKRRIFRPASVVHHKIPRAQAPELALKLDNLESLCPACHNAAHPEKRGAKKDLRPAPVARVLKL